MSFRPDYDATNRSTEYYSRVGSLLDWAIALGASSSIFFGFFLDITVNPPSYLQLFYNIVLLAALYAVTTATVMFIMPIEIAYGAASLPFITIFVWFLMLRFNMTIEGIK